MPVQFRKRYLRLSWTSLKSYSFCSCWLLSPAPQWSRLTVALLADAALNMAAAHLLKLRLPRTTLMPSAS